MLCSVWDGVVVLSLWMTQQHLTDYTLPKSTTKEKNGCVFVYTYSTTFQRSMKGSACHTTVLRSSWPHYEDKELGTNHPCTNTEIHFGYCRQMPGCSKEGVKNRVTGVALLILCVFWCFFVMYILSPTLLHLPPLRFHCAGGCWDWTQDCCDFWHWQSDALTTWVALIRVSA